MAALVGGHGWPSAASFCDRAHIHLVAIARKYAFAERQIRRMR